MVAKGLMTALACAAAAPVFAQSLPPASQAMATPAAQKTDEARIAVKTIVEIAITDALSSKTNVIGDFFAIKLAKPLVIDGRTVLQAGLIGKGEVTHAAKSGGGGKAGELIVNARFLECGGLRIPLGHFHHSANGQSNVGGAFATAQVIPFGQFLVKGGEAAMPAGTSGTAQVNADVVIPASAAGPCSGNAG